MTRYMIFHSRDRMGYDLAYCENNGKYYKWHHDEKMWAPHGSQTFYDSQRYWHEFNYSYVTEKYMKLRGRKFE